MLAQQKEAGYDHFCVCAEIIGMNLNKHINNVHEYIGEIIFQYRKKFMCKCRKD